MQLFIAPLLLLSIAIPRTASITDARLQEIAVEEHNRIRTDLENTVLQVDGQTDKGKLPRAVDMQQVSWDAELAKLAQAHADTCPNGHSGTSGIGENMAYRGDTTEDGVKNSINGWFNEAKDWWYSPIGKSECTGVCGHFTQAIWSKSTQIGCGIKDCSATPMTPFSGTAYNVVIVCNYKAAGNMVGQYPYKCEQGATNCPTWPQDPEGSLCISDSTYDTKTKHNDRMSYAQRYGSNVVWWSGGQWVMSGALGEGAYARCSELDLAQCSFNDNNVKLGVCVYPDDPNGKICVAGSDKWYIDGEYESKEKHNDRMSYAEVGGSSAIWWSGTKWTLSAKDAIGTGAYSYCSENIKDLLKCGFIKDNNVKEGVCPTPAPVTPAPVVPAPVVPAVEDPKCPEIFGTIWYIDGTYQPNTVQKNERTSYTEVGGTISIWWSGSNWVVSAKVGEGAYARCSERDLMRCQWYGSESINVREATTCQADGGFIYGLYDTDPYSTQFLMVNVMVSVMSTLFVIAVCLTAYYCLVKPQKSKVIWKKVNMEDSEP